MPRTLFNPGRGHRVPVHVWARDASEETLAQLERIASRPYAALRVAAMADAHVAEGVAVGTVFATERTVVPRALGGDLGCGVAAIRLSVPASELDRATLDRVVSSLLRAIPAGDAVHRGRGLAVPDALFEDDLSTRSLERTRDALVREAPRHARRRQPLPRDRPRRRGRRVAARPLRLARARSRRRRASRARCGGDRSRSARRPRHGLRRGSAPT